MNWYKKIIFAGRGLYNQPQGDSYNQQAGDEAIQDWELSNREELRKMKALAQQGRLQEMANYREELIQQGYPPTTVDKIMTSAMHGVKL